jgi:hypothetical protein
MTIKTKIAGNMAGLRLYSKLGSGLMPQQVKFYATGFLLTEWHIHNTRNIAKILPVSCEM